MKNVMLDLETLSLDNNAVIVSISAIEFDLETGELGSGFEVGLNILEQALNGGDIDQSTLTWWSSQSDTAKKSLTKFKPMTIGLALTKFNNWLDEIDCKNNELRLWGNGSSFDNVILRNLYTRHNETFILPYWCDTDVRTLVTLSGINTKDFKFSGVKHNGIDDCKHQINYCCVANKQLKGK